MIKRHLIITSDEKTWKFDRPVLFLGEWCLRYDRKHIWSKLDYEVAKPFGISSIERQQYTLQCRQITNELISELTSYLNKVHKLNFSIRDWSILIGHWLNTYVSTLFNRFHTIEYVYFPFFKRPFS